MQMGLKPRKPRGRWHLVLAGLSFVVLAASEVLLIGDILSEFSGFEFDFLYDYHQELETLAVISLGFSLLVVGAIFLHLLAENREFRTTVDLASGEFLRVLDHKFTEWNLSVSEREIALLLIKGLSIQEIGDVRNTKPGTIKSQSNAVYHKANVKGRSELAAYFVEDLLSGQDLTTSFGARFQ